MLKSFLKKVWMGLPSQLRLILVRLTQVKFTASVVAVVFNSEDNVLLLEHFLRFGSGWALPGGFVKANEQPEEAIRREIFEESGLEIKNLKLVCITTRLKHLEILFYAEAEGLLKPNSYEVTKAEWFSIRNLPSNLSETQKHLIEKALRTARVDLLF